MTRSSRSALKVLHLCAGNLFGGLETVLLTFARARTLYPQLAPHFGLCFDGELRQKLLADNLPVELLGAVRASRPWTILRARRALSQLLARADFDAVVCHSAWPYAIFADTVRKHQLPLAIWLHGQVRGPYWLESWAAATTPDLVICVSAQVAALGRTIYPAARVEVLYNPFLPPPTSALRSRAQVRAELATPADAVVIIQASRLEAIKGHDRHLAALAALRDLPNWVCWLAGGAQRPAEQQYLRNIQARAAELGIGARVRFLGQRNDVASLLAAADIYCQPNTGPEGFSLAFIEALAARLPVVTTAIGGALEIINDDCGALVPLNDHTALVARLRELITDPALRAQKGAAGGARVAEQCDLGAQVQRLHDYLSAIAAR